MRGGFVACFGGNSHSWKLLEGLAGQLRWHRGTLSTYEAGPLKIAVLADDRHGPAVSIDRGSALLVHGAEPAPLVALQNGHSRFAALEWNGRLLCAGRDPMGEVPLFFRIADGAAWFATETHPLVALAPTAPDLQALAAEVAFVPYTMRTAWRGVLRVPPGSTAEIDTAMQLSVSPYWRPDLGLAKRHCPYSEAVREFRERFEVAVARRRTRSSGVLLSGGLDSAAVALAARDNQHTPRLITVVFPEFPETDESEYARATATAAGLPLTELHGRTDPWGPEGEPDIFGTTSTLLPTGIFDVAMAAFADEGTESVLDGHDGDSALGIHTDIYGLLLAHLQVRWLVYLARHQGWRTTGVRAIRQMLPPAVSRTARPTTAAGLMMPYFRGATLRRMAGDARWRFPSRSWKQHQLLPLLPPLTLAVEQMEAWAARFGVDLLHPFADRDLLGFLLSLPFSIKVNPTRTKPLLRDALADLLPEPLRTRPGKVMFDPVLERRVDRAICLRWIRESGVELPDLDYRAFFQAAERDPASVPLHGWIRLARAHRFAATS
jgi:asparagine synthase (glutamine-hydrolysing)